MRVLVTGAAGFIGQYLVRKLSQQNEVLAAYRSSPGGPAPGVEWVQLDLGSSEFRSRLPRNLDGIIHLAQSANYRDFPVGAPDVFNVNVAATARLVEHAVEAGAKAFVLASSGSVYAPSNRPIEESGPKVVCDLYGTSKLAAEILCGPYMSELSVSTLRLFFPYGPQQQGRLIPTLIERVLTGRPVTLSGPSGGMRFNPMHVDDVVRVFVAALTEGWSEVLNVGVEQTLTVREAALIIAKRLGRRVSFDLIGETEPLALVPDLTRLRARLDTSHFRSFNDGIESVLTAVER